MRDAAFENINPQSSYQPEAVANLVDECLGLLERGEVSALGELIEVHDLGEPFLGPSPGRAEYLFRENRAADRNGHRIGYRQRTPKAFPVQARGGCGVCRKPIQHYVVEQFIAGKHILRMAVAVGPGPELFQYPGELPGRRVGEPVANRLWPRTLLLGVA